MQIKITKTYHYPPIIIAKIKKTDTTKCWQECAATRTLIDGWWKWKKCAVLWKTVGCFFIKLNVCLLTDYFIPFLDIYPNEMETCPQEDLSKNVNSKFVYCVSRGSLTTQEMSQEIVGAGGQAGDPEKSQYFRPKSVWTHDSFFLW